MNMTIGLQVLIFGMTGLLIYVGVYYIVPKQIKRGKSSLVSFRVALFELCQFVAASVSFDTIRAALFEWRCCCM